MSLLRSEQPNVGNNQDGFPTQNKKLCYFYIVIPPEDQAISQDISKVVSSTQELTVIMKRNPRARFQSASTPEEAEKKALDKIQFSKEAEFIVKPKVEERDKRKGRQSFSAVEESIGSPALESPKTGELLMMEREIITNQNEKVFERIAKNPRILCTDTEFPTILQEGCKYNAMHLAAKSNNFSVMKRILNLVSCTDFLKEIYPKQSEERLRSAAKHLLFSYLNSPDKMMQETPLHFACKFNAVECVELLLSHPFCDTSLKNFEKQTAFQVTGSRGDSAAKVKAIKQLFTDRFIVPVWRDRFVDGEAPVLGKVSFIPDLGQDIPAPLLHLQFPNFSVMLLEPCKAELAPTVTNLNDSTVRVFASHSSNWQIRAFAGPMSEAKANEFRKVMRRSRGLLVRGYTSPDSSFNLSGNNGVGICASPPSPKSPTRSQQLPNLLLSPIRSPVSPQAYDSDAFAFSPMKAGFDLRVRDVEKGIKRIALEYCMDLKIPWSEYWQFLGKFCDLSNESGIDILEAHFHKLEAERRDAELEELITSTASNGSANLDDIIDQFKQLRLNSSGITSPRRDSEGFCTNARCRLNARFCNCIDVVPPIPFDIDNEYSWMCEKIENIVQGIVPLSSGEMREPRKTGSSDSHSLSFSQDELQLQYGMDMSDVANSDDVEEYKTAPSSPVEHEVFEDCNNKCVFLSGDERPGKFDYQLYTLLKDFNGKVDSSKHFRTFQWLSSMRAHGDTLAHSRRNDSGYTPRRLWEPSFVSTPRRKFKREDYAQDENADSSF